MQQDCAQCGKDLFLFALNPCKVGRIILCSPECKAAYKTAKANEPAPPKGNLKRKQGRMPGFGVFRTFDE